MKILGSCNQTKKNQDLELGDLSLPLVSYITLCRSQHCQSLGLFIYKLRIRAIPPWGVVRVRVMHSSSSGY